MHNLYKLTGTSTVLAWGLKGMMLETLILARSVSTVATKAIKCNQTLSLVWLVILERLLLVSFQKSTVVPRGAHMQQKRQLSSQNVFTGAQLTSARRKVNKRRLSKQAQARHLWVNCSVPAWRLHIHAACHNCEMSLCINWPPGMFPTNC